MREIYSRKRMLLCIFREGNEKCRLLLKYYQHSCKHTKRAINFLCVERNYCWRCCFYFICRRIKMNFQSKAAYRKSAIEPIKQQKIILPTNQRNFQHIDTYKKKQMPQSSILIHQLCLYLHHKYKFHVSKCTIATTYIADKHHNSNTAK